MTSIPSAILNFTSEIFDFKRLET